MEEIGYRPEFLEGNIVLGRNIEISMPNGEKRKAAFAVVDANNILASHNENNFADTQGYPTINGENINDRNYKDDVNAQAKVIEVAQNLDPNILISTSKTPSGTPIISEDGIVVSGNNRTMSIKRAITQHPQQYQAYKDALEEEAFAFGIQDYSTIENPILVRIDYDFPAYNTTELSKYNKDTKKSERPIDKAIKIGKILNENSNCKTLVSELVEEYETFSDFYAKTQDQKRLRDILVDCNIISQNDLAAMYDERGFTESGKDLVETLLAGIILDKPALTAAASAGVRSFRQTLITSLPILAKNNTLADYSLIPTINAAFLLQKQIHDSGLDFENYIVQLNIFEQPPHPHVFYMNRLLASGRNKFKAAIEAYNNSAVDNMNESLFGDQPTPEKLFQVYVINRLPEVTQKLIQTIVEDTNTLELESESKLKPTSTETIIVPAPTTTAERLALLTGDNFYRQFPDHVLGEPYITSGRYGDVTKYKGNISDLNKINADTDLIQLQPQENPLVSVSVSKTQEPETIEQKQNLEKAITETLAEKKSKPKTKGKPEPISTEAQTIPFEEVYNLYNSEITPEELQVFVWYKEQIRQPLSGKWYALAKLTPGLPAKKEWIENGILAYFRGELLPAYLYYAGNIWERKSALENDRKNIVELYGESVYNNQKEKLENIFKISYDKRLVLTNPDAAKRLKILPISKFANIFTISTLVDEKEFKMKAQPEKGKNPGSPDFLYTGRMPDYKKKVYETLTLTEAFQYWLVEYRGEYEIKKDTDYSEIIRIYINQGQRPSLPKTASAQQIKEAEAVWQRKVNITKEEGDRLFSIFLANWLLPNDIVKIETTWNERYNGYLPVNYNKIPVAFSHGIEYRGGAVDVRPEKREAVAFLMNEGSGCLAYDVGVGKTWSALFAIKQLMEAGYCKRPLICVPNQTYKQWLAEGKGLLPNVKFNDLYNLGAGYLADLKNADDKIEAVDEYSISVITYEGLERIGFTDTTANSLLDELHEILNQGDMDLSSKAGKKQFSALMDRLQMLVGRGLKGTRVNIEDLGFDFACYDEAHKMKKVFVAVKGEIKEDGEREKNPYKIQSGGQPSSIALKGFMLSQYIQRNNNDRNILLLTATPFTNSPLEVFSVLTFIAYSQLRQTGLNNLKSFFDNYVQASNELVINAQLKPERKQVVMGFNNLQSLQQLIFRFINYKTGESVNVKRPNKWILPLTHKLIDNEIVELAPGEQILTQLPMSAQQYGMMENIKAYAEGKTELSAICSVNTASDAYNEDISDDETSTDATAGVELDENTLNDDEKAGVRTLRSMSFARNLALSPYLYECSGLGSPDHKNYIETSPKLSYVMACVKSVKTWHEKNNTPVSGQIIYMDRGIEYFDLIKEYLIKEIGYKEHEVGIIRSQMPGGKDAKEKVKMKFLGEAYNEVTGEVEDIPDTDRMKIVIGSSTIKEGINLQKHSTVLYNCFVDWNPTDIKQLEGRIWRQGNLYKNVRIVTPLMENSMDVFIFQKLQEKTSRIAQLLERDEETNTFRIEEFNPKEIKEALVSDPYVLAEMQLLEDKERIEDEIRGLKNEETKIDKILEAKSTHDRYREDLIEFVKKYRSGSAYKDSSTLSLIRITQEILKTQTDAKGLPMEYRWNRVENKTYSELDPAGKPYYLDNLILANRTLLKAEKEYLVPKQLTIEKLPDYQKHIQQQIQEMEKAKTDTITEANISALAESITRKREMEAREPASVKERVKEFESLNHLLADKKEIKVEQVLERLCPPTDAAGTLRTDQEALEELGLCVSTMPDTKTMHTNKKGEYTPERLALHKEIINNIKKEAVCISKEKPIAILTGGKPGSGKSYFLKNYAPYLLGPQLFKIDADAIRESLPEYTGWNAEKTHMEASDIVKQLLDDIGTSCKYDIIYDGTMNKAKKYIELIKKLKKLGYETYIIYMDVPDEVSQKRVLERYQRTGRFVPPFVLQEIYDAGNKSFKEIKDTVTGYMVVDGVTGKITETGGKPMPTERDYENMNGAAPTPYQASIEGLEVLLELAETPEQAQNIKNSIAGLQVLMELS